MALSDVFNKNEHNETIIDCFLQMWRHSADLMFIMAVEENGEFSLYDNNPASRAVLGFKKNEPVHRLNLRAQLGDEMVEQFYDTYKRVIENKKPISIEQEGVDLDGNELYFDTLFVPVFDDSGEPIYVCGASRDITKIKDAEKIALQANEKLVEYTLALETINQNLDLKVQERTKELEDAKRIVEESLEAKSSFVARMSHEIRTPINAVIGLSHLNLKTPLSDEQKDYSSKILESGEVLLNLVNGVLDFSKIEAGQMHIEVVPFSPRLLVQHAINMNLIKAQEKKLVITTEVSPLLPSTLIGDPLRIQQILVNLVTNAIKFTEQGGVRIHLYSENHNDQEILFKCDVIDTGIGIPESDSELLFKSFQQADDSITRRFGGTGLGLTISHKLCELMGGNIWFKSETGNGSIFSFSLPLKIGHQEVLSERDVFNTEDDVPNLSAFNILLAEDNLINRKVILGYLEDTLINVDIVENGQEAIDKLKEKKYDLILMDIQMPVMDGLTATKLIRASSFYNNIPILAMTAHVSEEAKKRSEEAGMNSHLDKPIKKNELYHFLQMHLNKKEHYGFLRDEKFSSLTSNKNMLSKLVEIDTLDALAAIKNLNGKSSMYLDLVTDFYLQYKDFSLENSLIEGTFSNDIHSLKSNSDYIGASKISLYCSILQVDVFNKNLDSKIFKSVIKEINNLIDDLDEILY